MGYDLIIVICVYLNTIVRPQKAHQTWGVPVELWEAIDVLVHVSPSAEAIASRYMI